MEKPKYTISLGHCRIWSEQLYIELPVSKVEFYPGTFNIYIDDSTYDYQRYTEKNPDSSILMEVITSAYEDR